jgi:hypothetical protein
MNRQEILTYVYYSNANLQPILHVTSQSLWKGCILCITWLSHWKTWTNMSKHYMPGAVPETTYSPWIWTIRILSSIFQMSQISGWHDAHYFIKN